jgi:hypothetical protein
VRKTSAVRPRRCEQLARGASGASASALMCGTRLAIGARELDAAARVDAQAGEPAGLSPARSRRCSEQAGCGAGGLQWPGMTAMPQQPARRRHAACAQRSAGVPAALRRSAAWRGCPRAARPPAGRASARSANPRAACIAARAARTHLRTMPASAAEDAQPCQRACVQLRGCTRRRRRSAARRRACSLLGCRALLKHASRCRAACAGPTQQGARATHLRREPPPPARAKVKRAAPRKPPGATEASKGSSSREASKPLCPTPQTPAAPAVQPP